MGSQEWLLCTRVTLPALCVDTVSGLFCFAIKAKVNLRESVKSIPTTLWLKSNGGFHPNLTRLIMVLNGAEGFASSCSSAMNSSPMTGPLVICRSPFMRHQKAGLEVAFRLLVQNGWNPHLRSSGGKTCGQKMRFANKHFHNLLICEMQCFPPERLTVCTSGHCGTE